MTSFARVSAENDLTVKIELTDSNDEKLFDVKCDASAARQLLHSLLLRFDPSVEQLRVVLLRHGLTVTDCDVFERRFGVKGFVPDTFRGVLINRDAEDKWLFGRGKGGVVHWEQADAADLLDLGIKFCDLENIERGKTVRFGFIGSMQEA